MPGTPELLAQRSRFDQIGTSGVVTKPEADLVDECVRFRAASACLQRTRKAYRRSELERFRLGFAGEITGALEARFGLVPIWVDVTYCRGGSSATPSAARRRESEQ